MTNKAATEQIFKLTGKVKWARVHTPAKGKPFKDEKTGETRPARSDYSVDLVSDEHNLKQILDIQKKYKPSRGLKRDNDGDEVIKFRREAIFDEEGKVLNPVQYIVDNNGDKVTSLIGNGSRATVAFRLKPYKADGIQRHVLTLVGLQVHDLVKYEGNGGEGLSSEGRVKRELEEVETIEGSNPFITEKSTNPVHNETKKSKASSSDCPF